MLRALAAYDEARKVVEAKGHALVEFPRDRINSDPVEAEAVLCAFKSAKSAWETAILRLSVALNAHHARAAVPVLPDESERDVSPHRFKAARGMEPL